jgi:tRNA(Ile)-lysidine synthase
MPDTRRLEEIATTLLAARAAAHPFVSWGQTLVQRHAECLILAEPRAAAAPYARAWNRRRVPELVLPLGAGRLQLVPSAQGPIDAAALPARLTVRSRQGGERLRPRAGGPSRTLKNLLQSESISLSERQNLPLLFAGEQLVAVADLWVDARWQAGPHTVKRMRLIWHRPV